MIERLVFGSLLNGIANNMHMFNWRLEGVRPLMEVVFIFVHFAEVFLKQDCKRSTSGPLKVTGASWAAERCPSASWV